MEEKKFSHVMPVSPPRWLYAFGPATAIVKKAGASLT